MQRLQPEEKADQKAASEAGKEKSPCLSCQAASDCSSTVVRKSEQTRWGNKNNNSEPEAPSHVLKNGAFSFTREREKEREREVEKIFFFNTVINLLAIAAKYSSQSASTWGSQHSLLGFCTLSEFSPNQVHVLVKCSKVADTEATKTCTKPAFNLSFPLCISPGKHDTFEAPYSYEHSLLRFEELLQ